MHSKQLLALIQRRPAHSLPQRIPQPSRFIVKETRIMHRRTPFQQLRNLRRQPLINLIPTRPKRITPGLRQRVDLQHGVVRGYALEGDIGVPACRCETRDVAELVRETAAFLLLFGAYHADLVA